MKDFCLSISLLLISLTTHAQALPGVAFAQNAFDEGLYELALYELNRLVFLQEPEVDPMLFAQIGRCYMEEGSYELAANFFDRYYFSTTTAQDRVEAVLLKTKSLVAQKQLALALTELFALQPNQLSMCQLQQFYLYEAVCQYELENYKAAEEAFLQCTTDTQSIQRFFANPKSFYRPNSSLAMIMSAVIPGLGQLYANEYQESLNSLLINAIFITYTIRISRNLSIFDAFISVLPWFQRYYAGGYNKASELAYDQMLENRKMKLIQILSVVEASPRTD